MGRKKIDIEPITNDRNKTVTFLKRKQGLFKKAFELSVLCSVDIQVVILGSNRQFYEYTTVNPEEMKKIYYKDNMIHNIQTPKDYDPKLHMKETIDLNDATRYKGPWNPHGKTNHKRTHSGRLVYTEEDVSNNNVNMPHHSKKHSKSAMSNDLEDIIEQDQYKNKHGHQHILKNQSLNMSGHMENSDEEDDQYANDDIDEDDVDDDNNQSNMGVVNNKNLANNNLKRQLGSDASGYDDNKNSHISAKKRRVNNSSLLKQPEPSSEIMGKGASYVFPNPLNSATDSDINKRLPTLDTQKIMNSDNGNNSFLQQQPHTAISYQYNGNKYNMTDLQIKTKQQYQGNDGTNRSFTTRESKIKNEFDSDNDNLVTPTSATSLTGMTFEPNLFTPNLSKMSTDSQRYQQSNPMIKNSPQFQQQSFTRRPRLRVEIPKTNKEVLQKQHESMQMRQNGNNPSSIIPLSARGGFGANNGTPIGPLSANLFSAMQYQAANNQLNTPNLNFFINGNNNPNDKSAPTSSYMQFLKNGYFDNYQQQGNSATQGNSANTAFKNRRQSMENNNSAQVSTAKQRQQLQSPTFSSFLENGFMMMSPDGPHSGVPNSRYPLNPSLLTTQKKPTNAQDLNGLDLDNFQEKNGGFANLNLKTQGKYQLASHFPQLQKQKRGSDGQLDKEEVDEDGNAFEGDDSNVVVPVSSKVGSAEVQGDGGDLVVNTPEKHENVNDAGADFLLAPGNMDANDVGSLGNNEFLK